MLPRRRPAAPHGTSRTLKSDRPRRRAASAAALAVVHRIRRGASVALRARWRRLRTEVTGSNLLQAAVTIVVAILVTVAALLSSAAAGLWQSSLRQEIRRSAGIVEDVRYVYTAEAPPALEVALAEARAAPLPDGDGDAARRVAIALKQPYAGHDHVLGAARYRLDDGGYDLALRLADDRRAHGARRRDDPGTALEAGDARRDVASVIAALTIPLVLAYVGVESVARFRQRRKTAPRRRQPAEPETESQPDVGLIPRPWSTPSRRRLGAAVAFGAWLIVTLLPAAQLRSVNNEQRAQAVAARLAVQGTTALVTHSIFNSFQLTSAQRGLALELRPLGLQQAALSTASQRLRRRLTVEAGRAYSGAERSQAVISRMTRTPTTRDGVDHAALAAMTSTPERAAAVIHDQGNSVKTADIAGRRANRISLALLLGALTLSLATLGAASGARGRRAIDTAAAVILATAAVAAVSSLLA